jgi:uroporphyrinogen III methyltransferase / synthase
MNVLITRPRAQSASFGLALQQAGFEPVYFPVIEIRPMEDLSMLDDALANLGRYAWVVFTSVNGVEVFFERPKINHRDTESTEKSLKKLRELSGSVVHFAAIGKKTTEALRKYGIEPFFVPDDFVSDEILPGLGDLQGKWVLLPVAEIARQVLPQSITTAGGVAHEIAVYRTLPAAVNAEGLSALKAGVDWVTFTSPSTVQNFAQIARQNGLDPFNLPGQPKIACIGPVTEQAAREAGFAVDVTASEFTTDGLIEVIVKQVAKDTSKQVHR